MHEARIVAFSLPMPPGINHQYVTTKAGRRVLSRESREWKKAAMRELEVMRFDGRLPDPFVAAARAGFLSFFLDFYFETPLRRDLDGGLKILQDTVCEVLGVDDSRVVDIHLVKRINPLHPHVRVQLEALPEWQFDDEYIYLGPDHPTP